MWNKKQPLTLVEAPEVLDEQSAFALQKTFDVDKMRNSVEQGVDLCGNYATFCANCDKSLTYPCARAYCSYVEAEAEKKAAAKKARAEKKAEAEVAASENAAPKKTRIAVAKRKK